ncbi:MAG: HDOD domain-containing protein [Leptothrix sp. (in: b-proteobacteria)]
MTTTLPPQTRHDRVDAELDWARTAGPVRTITIPPCPELLARLQVVMGEPDPDWDAICSIASADVAMAASLVRAANSPLYARNSTVQGVPQAISLLGLRQAAAQLTQFLSARALPVHHPQLEHFWRTSARRALAMGYIARQLYGVPPDLAHTCGLFCDIGVPLLLQGLRGYAGTWIEARARQDRLITATEQAAHQTDHAIVGALVARTWRLAPDLKLAIRLHHDPDALADSQLDDGVRNLIAASTVAEHIVNSHEGHPDTPEWVQRGHLCLQHLQVHADELVLWQDSLLGALDHVQ